ncbi:MAG: glycerophosphoryl diester phosphodiesterase membrane domain-containing protein [Dehalococcoidia bacterium]|nr:glycerophosphoryl diester phosphodiesterase membrane domain-containing protein [Dehalococcoidia bacterium]
MSLSDILRGAFRAYCRYPRELFLVALVMVPLGLGWALVISLLADQWILTLIVLPITFGVLGTVIGAGLIRAAADALEGTTPGFWRSYAAVIPRLDRLVLAALCFQITVQLLMIVILGIPIAVYLLIRWLFFGQAIMLEDAGAGEAFKRSGDLVAGFWWRVFGILLVIGLVSLVPVAFVSLVLLPGLPGGMQGLGLLPAPPVVSATVTSVIGAIIAPFVVSAQTILFFDQRERRGKAALAAP